MTSNLYSFNPLGVELVPAGHGLLVRGVLRGVRRELQSLAAVPGAGHRARGDTGHRAGDESKYYIKRPDLQPEARFTPSTVTLECAACGLPYERPDMVDCSFHQARLCSQCCSPGKKCRTVCHESQAFLGLPVAAPR